MRPPAFVRLTDAPLLDTAAAPWCRPAQVVKGGATPPQEREVRRTIMHPCVIEAARFSPAAPARYLLYYAPHHSDGIGAAAADHIEGPWTPLAQNPIVRLGQSAGLHGHISGPDVLWVPEDGAFRMYLHGVVPGQGQQTGVAVSRDGVRFEPLRDGPVLPHPYLRVFRHEGLFYGVCRVGNNLGLTRSRDGIAWDIWPRGLLLRTGARQREYDRIRHHCVRIHNDHLHIYYCTYIDPELRVEAIRLAVMRLEGDWTGWQRPRRVGDVLRPALDWERSNLRDPYVTDCGGRLYMFYVGGNEAGIALAAQPPR